MNYLVFYADLSGWLIFILNEIFKELSIETEILVLLIIVCIDRVVYLLTSRSWYVCVLFGLVWLNRFIIKNRKT